MGKWCVAKSLEHSTMSGLSSTSTTYALKRDSALLSDLLVFKKQASLLLDSSYRRYLFSSTAKMENHINTIATARNPSPHTHNSARRRAKGLCVLKEPSAMTSAFERQRAAVEVRRLTSHPSPPPHSLIASYHTRAAHLWSPATKSFFFFCHFPACSQT